MKVWTKEMVLDRNPICSPPAETERNETHRWGSFSKDANDTLGGKGGRRREKDVQRPDNLVLP